MNIEVFSWLGMVLTVLGTILCIKKLSSCWIVYIIGSISWIIYAVLSNQLPLLMVNGAMIVFNVFGLLEWTRATRKDSYTTIDAVKDRQQDRWMENMDVIEEMNKARGDYD